MPKANEEQTAQQSDVVCLETNDQLRFRVLFEKGSISVSNNTFLLRDKNKNYLRVHTFSDNTGIG